MFYPPKVDPMNPTWVIAVCFKLDKLKIYCEQINQKPDCQQFLNNCRTQIFTTFYSIVGNYDFKYRMQNSLVFNNSTDATKAFKAVSLGIKNSWVKYFVEKIHLFKVEPNSNASELLELEKPIENNPDWLDKSLIQYLQATSDSEIEYDSQ